MGGASPCTGSGEQNAGYRSLSSATNSSFSSRGRGVTCTFYHKRGNDLTESERARERERERGGGARALDRASQQLQARAVCATVVPVVSKLNKILVHTSTKKLLKIIKPNLTTFSWS